MGGAVSSPRSFPDSATSSDRATLVAISPCTPNTSCEVRFERLLPPRGRRDSAGNLHQLGREADPARRSDLLPPDLGEQEIAHPKLLRDLLGRLRRRLVLVRAAARDDRQAGQPRELAPHLVGHPVREVPVLRRAQVLEGEHRQPLRARSAVGAVAALFPRRASHTPASASASTATTAPTTTAPGATAGSAPRAHSRPKAPVPRPCPEAAAPGPPASPTPPGTAGRGPSPAP